ncbi:uncharacterized protein LOC131299838 [Rhododendron vialii]|uniref:uncharacterized protein LOC131299838 n=1 Tax=Rhododendron vialii TaxID=182163 RepID=UPI00265D7B3B|nr:uncharacterized protein LOC131299838 [Rhododendron vialii]
MASSSKQVSLKLLIDAKNNKVLFAEAGKDFVDFLFTLLSLPVGSVIRLLTAKSMVGCLGNLYGSIENMNETYMQPNHNKEDLLKPKAVVSSKEVPLLLTDDVSAVKKVYMCGSYHRFITYDPRAICPTCKYTISTEVPFVAPEVAKDGFSGEGGYVKGVVTYMVMDDLVVTPMSTISGIAMLSKCNVTNVGALEEKVVSFGMDEMSGGSSTKFTRRDEEIWAQVMEQFGHARTYGLGGFFTDVLGGGYRQSQEQNRIFQAQLQDQFQLYQVQFETQMKDTMDTQIDAMLTETQSQAATIQ